MLAVPVGLTRQLLCCALDQALVRLRSHEHIATISVSGSAVAPEQIGQLLA
jgi:hypothetical protein